MNFKSAAPICVEAYPSGRWCTGGAISAIVQVFDGRLAERAEPSSLPASKILHNSRLACLSQTDSQQNPETNFLMAVSGTANSGLILSCDRA